MRAFFDTVANSWNKPTHKSNTAANLNAKFKRLRYDLKKWSKSISKLSVRINNCNKSLLELDELEDSRGLIVPEVNFRRIIKQHLICMLEYQKQYWKKKGAPFVGPNLGMRIQSSFNLLLLKDTGVIPFPS
jgi:hypothetical protein